jgi:hypothetical protein
MTVKNDRMPRGSSPPHLKLSEAFALAVAIWEQGAGHCSFDVLSKITNNSTSSSSFLKKFNALKAYGLIEPSKSEVILTDNGRNVVAPASPLLEAAARKMAFLNIDVYAKVYERHRGKLMPADEFLRNIIEVDCGIPRELSETWVVYFKDAVNAAGLLFNRSDGKIQITEAPILPTPQLEAVTVPGPKLEPQQAPKVVDEKSNQSINFNISGHTTRIELSGKRFAVFAFPDSLTQRDAQKIKGALAGMGAIIDSMVEPEGQNNT